MKIKQEGLTESINAVLWDVTELRRNIHRDPELSFNEYKTAEKIEYFLSKEKISFQRVAKTGILARIDCTNPCPEKPVVLRADMDALKIEESSSLEFRSQNQGVMHACGHDVHSACLAGALAVINRNKHLFSGTVLGLFQPGEELHPGGASLIITEGVFEAISPRAFIAQHLSPELPVGTFGFHNGISTASSDDIQITLHSQGGHAALAHTFPDPVYTASQMIVSMQQITSRNADPKIPTILSFGRFIADGATNIIPSNVLIQGTLRTMNEEWRKEAKQRLRCIAQSTAQCCGIEVEIAIKDGFPSVFNDSILFALGKNIASEIGTAKDVDSRMTAEDFGFYSQLYPSLFYRLGCGFADERPESQLHTSEFEANEEAIRYGIAMLTAMCGELCQ